MTPKVSNILKMSYLRLMTLGLILILSTQFCLSWTVEDKSKIALGRALFFDPILSKDSTISCASCHNPRLAFADSVAISPGIGGLHGTRNAPSIMNMTYRGIYFYDGRAANLREQVHFPIEDTLEMASQLPKIIDRLNHQSKYKLWFKELYNEDINAINLADAIASFEESLETADTEFDAWMNDKPNQMSDEAIRGRTLFMSDRAKCFDCHFSPDFTGDEFKNIGLYDESAYKDKGRFMITKNKSDLGKFKVPGLRNIAVTAPYMHDGSFKSLDQVIEYYSDPSKTVKLPINMDTTLLKPILFTDQEKRDLKAFLISLTDRQFLGQLND